MSSEADAQKVKRFLDREVQVILAFDLLVVNKLNPLKTGKPTSPRRSYYKRSVTRERADVNGSQAIESRSLWLQLSNCCVRKPSKE
jgi:hypothetical protein